MRKFIAAIFVLFMSVTTNAIAGAYDIEFKCKIENGWGGWDQHVIHSAWFNAGTGKVEINTATAGKVVLEPWKKRHLCGFTTYFDPNQTGVANDRGDSLLWVMEKLAEAGLYAAGPDVIAYKVNNRDYYNWTGQTFVLNAPYPDQACAR